MLHIVKSQSSLENAIPYIDIRDTIALIEDAVYCLNPKHYLYPLLGARPVFAVEADLSARGITGIICPDSIINFRDLVRLTVLHTPCTTW